MPRGPQPGVAITLSPQEREMLEATARATTTPQRDALRAKIVLRAAEAKRNAAIARELGCDRDTVIKWRKRFAANRFEGLKDAPRPGRAPVYDATVRASVISIACQLPAERNPPLSRLSITDIHHEAQKVLTKCPSPSTIRTILAEDALKPWRYRSWITPRDPEFAQKAGRVLDLYQGTWEGQPLEPQKDLVLSLDEKTGIQALERVAPTQAPKPGKSGRVEHEYKRHGVVGFLAALFIATGHVVAQCITSNSKENFRAFVSDVLSGPLCKGYERIFLIMDNGSAHHPRTFPVWIKEHFPHVIVVYTPKHASWLNQVEIFFSVLTRKALTPRDVASLEALRTLLLRFVEHHNQTARPYRWGFTRADMERVLARLDQVLAAAPAVA